VPLDRARDHASKADVCLALGSSLTVSPANEIPEVAGQRRGAKLVICNLQNTPLDSLADLRVHAKTDDLMDRVMEKLDIPIPPFILHRRLVVELESKADDRHQLMVRGVDVDGTPVTFLRSVKLEYNRRVARTEPFSISFRGALEPDTELKIELEFMGHYGEPNLQIVHEHETQMLYFLEYNPQSGEWKTTKQTSLDDGGDMDVQGHEASAVTAQDIDVPGDAKASTAANVFPDLM